MKDGQTIGQWLKWDFEVDGDFEIRNKDNKLIYLESSDGYWAKREYDSRGYEVYYEHSFGDWVKREYDSRGYVVYHENSDGVIMDNRIEEIIEHQGHKYQLIR